MARSLGSLVLVVGPSGVGKDTLIAGARQALENDKRFIFVRRLVTQRGEHGEDQHLLVDAQEFSQLEKSGRLALSWEAHDRRYALPLSVDTDLALGKIVVASVSRHVVAQARKQYPSCAVVQISAEISRRAERLVLRGHESADQITARLARESAPVPPGIAPIMIDNSGSIANGVTAFVIALRAIAAQD